MMFGRVWRKTGIGLILRMLLAGVVVSAVLFEHNIPFVKSEINVDRNAIVENALKACNEGWHYLKGAEGEIPDDESGYPERDNNYQMPEEGEVTLNEKGKAYNNCFKTTCENPDDCEDARHTDCSGLVFWAYTNWNNEGCNTGITKNHIGRLTASQYANICKKAGLYYAYSKKTGKFNKNKQPEKGDLLFFINKTNRKVEHVGIIVSWTDQDKSVVHASFSRKKVVKDPWNNLKKSGKYDYALGDLVSAIQKRESYKLKTLEGVSHYQAGEVVTLDAGYYQPVCWMVNGRKTASSYEYINDRSKPIYNDATFTVVMDNNYVIQPRWKCLKAAIFKDMDLGGYPANEVALNGSFYEYDVFNSTYFGQVNLSTYRKVIIAGGQSPDFYSKVSDFLSWFEGYVANNYGVLEMHISPCDYWYGFLPLGLFYTYYDDYVKLAADEEHPILNSPNMLCEDELFACGYLSPHYYTNYLNVIAYNTYNQPVWIEFGFGNGAVIATTIPVESLYAAYNWSNGEYGSLALENMVIYPDFEDISIQVTPYKEIFARGYPITMDITAINRGLLREVFTIEVYLEQFWDGYDEKIPLDSKTIFLTTLSSYTFTLQISYPSLLDLIDNGYFLVINVEPKHYETNEEDNNIFVVINPVIPGDINADGIVNIFDAVLLAAAAGSKPHDPHWNPNADINNDLTVDIFDAVILVAHAGETDP